MTEKQSFSKSDEDILNKCKFSITQELNKLTALDQLTKKEKNSDIKKMIEYYTALTQKKEDGREKIYQFSLQLLVICITASGLFLTQNETISRISASNLVYSVIFTVVFLILLEQILFTLIAICLYHYQSSFPYPFRTLEEYGNRWKWFYYGNKEITEISTREIFPETAFNKTIKPYLDGLQFFIHEYTEEDLDKELKNNITQLYLLQIHNYYKNRFHLHLSRIQKYSIVSLIATLVLAILYLIFQYFIL